MPANQLRYGAAKHPTEGANYGEESYHVGHPEFSRYSPSYSNLQKIVDEVQACNLHFQLPEKKMAMKPAFPKAEKESVLAPWLPSMKTSSKVTSAAKSKYYKCLFLAT
mmetsp:Transcript_5586/g.23718  ORF Transcript_5586/g.23718 Transcript_5586/m.23718 type:complete len:108 (+) Transcript_5586:1760-2083(+)